MHQQIIKQIKEMPGIKTVSMKEGFAVIEFEPENWEDKKGYTPISFKLQDGKYIDFSGNEISTEELLKHPHSIEGQHGVLYKKQMECLSAMVCHYPRRKKEDNCKGCDYLKKTV